MPESVGESEFDREARNPVLRAASALLDGSNRGRLLDFIVFLSNLFLMSLLAGPFLALIRRATSGDSAAGMVLFCFGLALFALPPLGASLKRWHYHRKRSSDSNLKEDEPFGGCLFNPIFYFCLVAVIFAGLNAAIFEFAYGRSEPPGAIFVSSIFVGLALIILHTLLVYRYFSPPKGPPRSAFLRGRSSEFLGDACLFANALFYQLVWSSMSLAGLGPPRGAAELIGRVFVLCFLALLLYFPPRMFYLAQDAGKARTWLMILLANSPLIARFVMGSGSNPPW